MPKPLTTIRIPTDVMDTANDLIAWVSTDPTVRATGRDVSRSTVLRIAIDLGLAEMRRKRDRAARPPSSGETP